MKLQVGELDEYLAKRVENTITRKLGDLSASDDATMLYFDEGLGKQQLVLDETASKAVCKFLKVPHAYYDKVTPDFRAQLLGYEFARHKEIDVALETLNGDLVAAHQPTSVMLPLTRVAEVISNVFEPEDTMRRVIVNDTRFHVDVTTSKHQLLVPGPENLVQNGVAVGDITEAGVRFLAYPFRTDAHARPSASVYAERLVCMNGQTTDERLGRIDLKGRNVDEVIAEMEIAAELLLGQLDGYLEKLDSTRTLFAPGSPQAFAQQLAREAKLSREVLDKVLDIINQLPGPVSIWDVNQAFTTVANDALSYNLMTKLQNLGGSLAFDAERMIERCTQCERLL